MKHLLLAGLLLGTVGAVRAQAPANCAALQTENAALKDQVAAYEARLGIGGGGARVEDGDNVLKVRFVSCKASRASHRAVLTFLVLNSGPAQALQLQQLATQDHPSQVVDEAGKAYTSTSSYYPMVGASQLKGQVPASTTPKVGSSQLLAVNPTVIPLSCTLTFLDVPTTTTRLSAAVLSFQKLQPNLTATGKPDEYFKTSILNAPVTWGP